MVARIKGKCSQGVQDKPKTEDSVPIILWKVVMLGGWCGMVMDGRVGD